MVAMVATGQKSTLGAVARHPGADVGYQGVLTGGTVAARVEAGQGHADSTPTRGAPIPSLGLGGGTTRSVSDKASCMVTDLLAKSRRMSNADMLGPVNSPGSGVAVEAFAPSRRPLPREDSDATGTAHDALLGTERSQGHRTSTLGCLDECQPGSGWHARCDCVAVAASHGCSADEATHHQKQVPRLPSKRARHFYPRR